MSFVSREFLLFFAAVFALHWSLPPRARAALLLAASAVFYGWTDPSLVALLAGVAACSYAAVRALRAASSEPVRSAIVWAATAAHLAPLLALKSRDAFFPSFELLRAGPDALPWLRAAFPIGLSYYTFQSLGLVLDARRGAAPAAGPVEHGLFVGFFPQLIAGPVSRGRELLPQISGERRLGAARLREAALLFFWGLFQKAVIADNLAPLVRGAFDASPPRAGGAALLTCWALGLQLYADFSGYTDMARGAALALGFELPRNFDLPWLAQDMREMWKRWHMSLSRWFSDHVYRPLLDAPLPAKLYAAPAVTMILMGLWHGLSAPMAAMGAFNGAVIAATLCWQSRRPPEEDESGRAGRVLRRILTVHLFLVGLVLMRSPTLARAAELFAALLLRPWWTTDAAQLALRLGLTAAPLALVQGLQAAGRDPWAPGRPLGVGRWALLACLGLVLLRYGNFGAQEFIYRGF